MVAEGQRVIADRLLDLLDITAQGKGTGRSALEEIARGNDRDIGRVRHRIAQPGEFGVAVDRAVDVVFVEDDDRFEGAFGFLVLAGKRRQQQKDRKKEDEGAFHMERVLKSGVSLRSYGKSRKGARAI